MSKKKKYDEHVLPCEHYIRDGSCCLGDNCMFIHDIRLKSKIKNKLPNVKHSNDNIRKNKDSFYYSKDRIFSRKRNNLYLPEKIYYEDRPRLSVFKHLSQGKSITELNENNSVDDKNKIYKYDNGNIMYENLIKFIQENN